ncbi:MAG: hypothetical protein B6229_03030 [Spirochaetaceae bacterium 4572_7]|nr:MAG: hypothetical protein B6229_03030 [Spirochaetaceae bacterium 4572_7]
MVIGIDLGGTNIKSGLLDSSNSLVFDQSRPTGSTLDEIVNNLAEIIDELKDRAKKEYQSAVTGVGIGVPGVVSKGLDHVFKCTNLGWHDIPLKELLSDRAGLPIFIDNDANLAALAELYIGSLKGVDTGLLLTLGTGIGGGVIINGKPYRGSNGLGMEIGHMVLGENFFDCSCGKNGCFETFSSATALVKYYEKLLSDNSVKSSFEVSAKNIFVNARAGDKLSFEAVDRTATYLAMGIVNVINILDPAVIALGGGMAGSDGFLLKMTREKVKKNLFVKGFPSAKIELATSGNQAGTIGAALLVREELEII